MFSRLTQGVSSVLQELSGEEGSEGNSQDGLVPQPQPDTEASLEGPGPPEEVLERLAQTEQLVIQLKELNREKDILLANTERQLKEEKEQAEVKFTKLKLQAKAKMTALNKQISQLKGQEALNSSQNSESSFTMPPAVEEELQQLREKLTQAESSNRTLQHQLWEAEQRVREEGQAEQVRVLQTVVKEKDVRFQEQILKHEQEILSLTQTSNDSDLQQALRASQQRVEELEESLRSRSDVLEMLQQELNSADQQKQILTVQFRQMEMELSEAQRLREEERQQWSMRAEELQALRARLEALYSEKEQTINALNSELLKKTTELDEMSTKLKNEAYEKEERQERLGEKESSFETELANMQTSFEAKLEKSVNERERAINALNSELLNKTTELDETRAKLAAEEREKNKELGRLRERETELTNMQANLEARLETSEREREEIINDLNVELLKKTTELDEMSEKLAAEEREKMEVLKDVRQSFETELANMRANLEPRLESSENEREQIVNDLNSELLGKNTTLDEMRAKLAAEEREKNEGLERLRERETELANMQANLDARLQATESEREQTIEINHLNSELLKKTAELDEMRGKLAAEEKEKNEELERFREREIGFQSEMANMQANLEDRLETSESEKEQTTNTLNSELLRKTAELDETRAKLAAEEREKNEGLETLRERETELANMQANLDARLQATESEREQTINDLNSELLKKTAELDEMRAKSAVEEKEKNEALERFRERETGFQTEMANMQANLEDRLETSESEKEQAINTLNSELLRKTAELDETRAKLAAEAREKNEGLETLRERETELINMKAHLEARLETSQSEREQIINDLNAQLLKKTTELDDLRDKLAAEEREKQEKQTSFETELANLQACLEAAEKQKEEMTKKLEIEVTSHMEEVRYLQENLDEVVREREGRSNSEQTHLSQVQNELESLRTRLDTSMEEQKAGQQVKDTLEELWRGLQSLTTVRETEEEVPIPNDPAQFLEVLPSLKAQLCDLTAEQQESQARVSDITLNLQSLQGQLDKSTAEREEAVARIQELEQQLHTLQVAGESSGDRVTVSVMDLDRAHQDGSGDGHSSRNALQTDQILFLEQQLADRERELSALREELTKDQSLNIPEFGSVDSAPTGDITGLHDISATLSEVSESTLVAVDTSVLSESSSDLIAPQPESSGESKGTSSDEMVTSSDSEVAHSSWTLLEAVNQDGTQEWPPLVQDLSSLRICTQSWDEACNEHVTSTSCIVDIESQSVVINETVQVCISQQEGSLQNSNLSTSQAFAQLLAEEIQKRYSELLGELQQLRDSALQSQEKVQQLEEQLQSFKVPKDEAESKANIYETELLEARALIQQEQVQTQNVTEQFQNLQDDVLSKDKQMQELRADLDEAHRRLAEQEGQSRMLIAQLEDREFNSSELEKNLLGMEDRLLQISQETDMTKAALLDRTGEVEALQKCLSQKDQEMMELNDSMTAKLLQAGEEKFTISSEVKKLKEQIYELETARDDQQKTTEDQTAENEKLVALQKENEDLVSQIAAIKKDGEQVKRKLQAALVQRKDLMKKVAEFEKEAKSREEKERDDNEAMTHQFKDEIKEKDLEIQRFEALFQETRDILNLKEETLISLQEKINIQEQTLTESHAEIQRLTEQYVKMNEQQMLHAEEDTNRLLLQISSMESDIERLHKKLQEATDAHENAVVKVQEKDHQHFEQIKEQKEGYSDLLKRFQDEEAEKAELLSRIKELESLLESKNAADNVAYVNMEENVGSTSHNLEKPETNDWAQDDWVDFASAETETQQQHKPAEQSQQPSLKDNEGIVNALQDEIKVEQAARAELELHLQESQSLADSKVEELCEELKALREKERQIDGLTEVIEALREKCHRAEVHAETLKAEVDQAWEAAKRSISDAESPIKALQSEVEEFKHFLKNKNDEIVDLSQQLSEQNSLLLNMQETVAEKDQQIASLQEVLKTEQDRVQKLEEEMPQREVEEKGNSAKLQQLQRKLQAALVSRKEALKKNQALKEEQAAAEKVRLELQQKLEFVEVELNKSKEERDKLIEEVDRTLLENQSLNASCESLKLAMEGILNEKDACKRHAESAKEEAQEVCRQLKEKIQSMKEEYETLLKSYENVSDEAERVRRVLEAARQERQELAAKARAHEAARQEADRLAEEAMKEVDVVKEKMRKFAKVKHQKIMDLEEENEKLRDQKDKKGTRDAERDLKTELETLKEELENLKVNYNIAIDEKNSFEQQAEELRQRLSEKMDRNASETLGTIETIQEVKVVAHQRGPDLIEKQEYLGSSSSAETNLQMQPEESNVDNEHKVMKGQTKSDMTAETERLRELETSLKTAESRVSELEAALQDQMELSNKQESMLNEELAALKKQLQESLERDDIQKEENSKKETQLQELRTSLEAERDDLEERLMNQLAQLNGSIAGYQQEAAHSRERLADMQRELENIKREQAELEAEVASERDRAARMEEDMRQAQRERAEAESEAGRQRELEQKLKSAQRFKEGSQNRTRQLEELLREKQLEVRQLQKDYIMYQERISELAKEVKSLLLGRDEVHAELEAARLDISKIMQERASIESELSVCKGKLDVALEETKQALADKVAAEKMVQSREVELKADAERTLDEVRYRLGAELKQMELRLEKAYRERERQEKATLEARSIAEAADKHSQERQTRLDEALARLAAFSRSMSSLQDDRDRVLDEAKQWENRFHSELREKEADVRESENRAKELTEQLQVETTQKEDLQSLLERMQKAEENLQLHLSEMEKKKSESLAALEKEKNDLQQKLTQVEANLAQTCSELTSLEAEAEGLRKRAKALEEAMDRLQSEVEEARTAIKERETEERRLCLRLEQLETDLSSSKNLTNSLQASLDEKEKREMELLGEKEQAVTQAVEEARKDADGRAELAEKELETRKEELRGLEERLRKAEEDAFQSKAQLESFTKAMGSLQDDRDRVLSQYKQLEERHLQVMMEKDNLIQEAAGENNGLKEEIRALLSQRDDLNAENAKLSAQLHGYRNDLNQVLAMKDSQHKQILAAQVERISVLERQIEELEIHIRALEKDGAQGRVLPVEREILSQASEGSAKHDAPGAEVEKLREQFQAARNRITSLEETLELEREAQAARNKELKELKWESGILRTESETAEERVAELARDLLMMEQQLLEEREAAAQLQSQNQSFGQAMASLQDTRDQAVSEAKELRLQLDEINQTGHSPSPTVGSKGEVWSLKNALSALQNDRERMLEQLRLQRAELNRLGSGELSRISQVLEEERRMAGDREKLLSELRDRDSQMERDKQELEMLRLERMDWQSQAELLKQQTLTALSDRDQELRQLTSMLEEARASKQRHEYTQRQGSLAVDAAPGGPLEHNEGYKAECIELQKRLDEETEQRLRVEEQLIAAQDHIKSFTQGEWQTATERMSETAVLIEPPEGAITRTRSGGPGLLRMLRVAFCSRQRTPLLLSLYLLTVHVLLLLCIGGYL